MNKSFLTMTLSSALALGSVASQAAIEASWEFPDYEQSPYYTVNSDYSRNFLSTDSAHQVTVTGWAAAGAGGTVVNRNQDLRLYSGGLGLELYNNEGVPEHSIDNVGADEFVMFETNTAITLNSLTVGYAVEQFSSGSYSQADVSVLAWTGSGDPSPAGYTISNDANGILQQGWTLVGHYSNVGTSGSVTINTSIASTNWAIGAYLNGAGGSTLGGNDNFKLQGIAGTFGDDIPPPPPQTGNDVPEPATLSLLGLGLLGLMRKRKLAA